MDAEPQIRSSILSQVCARLQKTCTFLRDVRVGPLRPVDVKPSATVCDNGQSLDDPDDDESDAMKLSLRIVLHLYDDWSKADRSAVWSNNVEYIRKKISRWFPANCGILDVNYVGDDPFDCVYMGGAVEAVWVIDFEVRYFDTAAAPGEVA